jgi:para-aminobenzoate synthetase component 1
MTVEPLIVPLADAPDPVAAYHRLRTLPFPALLEGRADHRDLGRWSYLSADPVERLVLRAAEWPGARDRLRRTTGAVARSERTPPFVGGWIGWLGYELGAAFDVQPLAPRDQFSDIDGELHLHDWVIAWDHVANTACLVSTGLGADGGVDQARARGRATQILDLLARGADEVAAIADATPRAVMARSFSPSAYQAAVGRVVEAIRAGDIFQANLSERYVVAADADALTTYQRLRALAPAAHAALLKFEDRAVLSASPECFLRYDSLTRQVESRPIKGTRPRGVTAEADAALANELRASVKDRAENLMIVDLVRNDLHRVAAPDSVAVTALCELDSHRTVHHLVSTVQARLRPEVDALDLLAATFPAGSITGAPKLRAMAILAELEPVARGVYCGAIGWLGLDGSLGLSVAIRTMMVRRGTAVVHAGGGVTLLSDPAAEYAESLDKVRAPLAALGAAP